MQCSRLPKIPPSGDTPRISGTCIGKPKSRGGVLAEFSGEGNGSLLRCVFGNPSETSGVSSILRVSHV